MKGKKNSKGKTRAKKQKIILLDPVKPSEEFMWEKWKKEIEDPLMQKFNLIALILLGITLAAYAYSAITNPNDVKTIDLLGTCIGIIFFFSLVVEAGYLCYKFFAGKKQGSSLLAFKDPTQHIKHAVRFKKRTKK